MGATRRQMLGKVQLPLARRMLLLGVNQTILFALSMVVIAGLIGGGGLGAVVTSGLYTNPALAILGGVAIVIMAMALDRATEAIADRTDPAKRHLDEAGKQEAPARSRSASLVVDRGRDRAVAKLLGVGAVYPDDVGAERADRRRSRSGCSARSRWVLDYVQDPTSWVFGITEPTGNYILTKLLLPIQSFLVESPWFATLAGLTLIAFVIRGLRPAITTFADARPDRRARRLGARDGHALAGARRDALRRRHRRRPRRRGGREQDGLEDPAADQRRAADAAAARLHHPVHLSDAGFDRPRNHRRCSLRVPRRRPPRRARARRRRSRDGRGGRRVRRYAEADPDEGEDPARRRRDHARRQPGHRSWCSPSS